MQIKALTNRLREAETNSCWDYYNQSKREHDLIEAEEILRERAERAFTKWLDKSYPDANKYKYPCPLTEHEKFMWIEGYLANIRGGG